MAGLITERQASLSQLYGLGYTPNLRCPGKIFPFGNREEVVKPLDLHRGSLWTALQFNGLIPQLTGPCENYSAERKAVLNEIDNAWAQVKGMAEPLPLGVGGKVYDSVMGLIRNFKIDGYDALYCHFMKEAGVTNILSDDKDFRCVGGLSLYSCYEK